MKKTDPKMLGLILITGIHALAAEPDSDQSDYQLPEINVIGQARGFSSFDDLPAVSKVSGSKLERKKQSTLGETLSREAGVSSTFFGPNSSRPVIRGLEGDRVRMLENGLGILDASGTSPDHAVSIDPMLLESVDIWRGPSALLFGNTAVGGVVNVRTLRISETLPQENAYSFQSRYTSVDQGKNWGGMTRFKLGNFVLHLDGAMRSAEDYSVASLSGSRKVENSFNRTSQGAMGLSYVGNSGWVGAAFSGYLTEYGTVAEPDVKINLDRVRSELAGELKNTGIFDFVSLRSAYNKYEHREIEGSTTGTVFGNRGIESRLDAKSGTLRLGLQQQYSKLEVQGEEAFLPTTQQSSYGIFGFHELTWGSFKPAWGLRFETASIHSESNPSFGEGVTKNYFSPSGSLGIQFELNDAGSEKTKWSLGLNATYSERAPHAQELFSNGKHVATNSYEVGNLDFQTEKNTGMEVFLKADSPVHQGKISAFLQSFPNFIALLPTGSDVIVDSEPVPEYRYESVKAKLFGAEFEYLYRMPESFLSGAWELEFKWDWVRGIHLTAHDFLPRMVPMRETLGLNYRHSRFAADLEIQKTERQNLPSRNETPTPGYLFVNLGAEVPFSTGFGQFKVILRGNNLFNAEGKNHVSFLKDLAPLPGRNLILGVQAAL